MTQILMIMDHQTQGTNSSAALSVLKNVICSNMSMMYPVVVCLFTSRPRGGSSIAGLEAQTLQRRLQSPMY